MDLALFIVGAVGALITIGSAMIAGLRLEHFIACYWSG